jgi:hypothetical protein
LSPAAAEGVILGGGFPLVLPVPHLAVLLLRLTLVVGGDLGERAGVCSATCVRGAFKVDALRDAVLRSSRMVSSKTLYFFSQVGKSAALWAFAATSLFVLSKKRLVSKQSKHRKETERANLRLSDFRNLNG